MNSAIMCGEEVQGRSRRDEGLLSFLVSRAKSASRSLTPSTSDVLNGCWDAVNQILETALQARTRADFDRVYAESFSRYIGLTMAISHFAQAVIQKPVLDSLVRESITEMESDFRDKAAGVFGAEVRDQAMFTVWTLRKINDLTAQIALVPLADDKHSEDAEFCYSFNINAMTAQFSLDCLNKALSTEKAIYPEVLDELVNGLRAMVNAYAWARRGLDIRLPAENHNALESISSPEDEDLMDFSFSEAGSLLESREVQNAVAG